ncbi:MAG: lasso peptide biosynthesis B2 protein [Chloroflexaceae bacterium]|nr:lasso peptide biosynthesis B2 protein [Chloroflexaceae bacterium]
MDWWKLLSRKCRTWSQLSCWEKTLFWQALALLVAVRGLLPLLGLKATARWLSCWLTAPPIQTVDETGARAIARQCQLAARYTRTGNCLQRSLVLHCLLRSRGIESELRLGVRRASAQFQAHAWVESGDAVLNDTPEAVSAYAAFGSRPGISWFRTAAKDRGLAQF